MRGGVAVLAGGLALVVFVGIAAAGPPLVSAGLDQEVAVGDPVYLDAGGTHVPDGELASLEWSIETPDGSTIDPNCVDCEVTWFRANQTGQYEVRLTAESASGVERSDAMYVSVSRWSATSSSSVSNVSAAGSGGGAISTGCFIAHEGDSGGPMDQGVCDEVENVLRMVTSSDGDSITHMILNDLSFARRYDGAEIVDDGTVMVPTQSVIEQSETLYEQAQEKQRNAAPAPFGNGGVSEFHNGGPNDETLEQIADNEEMELSTCNNLPSSYC